jgi:hypothetical protein
MIRKLFIVLACAMLFGNPTCLIDQQDNVRWQIPVETIGGLNDIQLRFWRNAKFFGKLVPASELFSNDLDLDLSNENCWFVGYIQFPESKVEVDDAIGYFIVCFRTPVGSSNDVVINLRESRGQKILPVCIPLSFSEEKKYIESVLDELVEEPAPEKVIGLIKQLKVVVKVSSNEGKQRGGN